MLTKTGPVAARRIGAIRREKVQWLWPGWLARGVLTLMGARAIKDGLVGWRGAAPEARILRNGLESKAAKGGDSLAALAALVGQALPNEDAAEP